MEDQLIRFDWAMKKLLRHKANFDILEGFLSELFGFDITIENILESEANQEDEYDKFNRVDILAKAESGELILVELQNNSQVDYFQRMIYGVSKLITQYISVGQAYKNIKKIFSVNIVYFDLGKGKDYIYTYQGDFIGLHRQDTLEATAYQKQEFGIEQIADIFPKYYLLKVNNFDKIAENTLDEWLYFLKNSEVKSDFKAKGLDQAKEKLRYESLSSTEKKVYERYQDARRIESSVKYTAKIEGRAEGLKEGIKEGIKEGRAKGIQEGLEKGIQEGLEKGIQEGLEKGKLAQKIEIAKSAIKNGLDDALIASLTDLSIDQIQLLRKD